MNFHQKLVVYYILNYFRILLILDIHSVLIEFILWDQRLSKRFILRNILRDQGTVKLYFLCLELCFNFCVNKCRKYSKLVAGFTFNSFSLRLPRNTLNGF